MGLRDIGETLPPGFKFNPSDDELVCHYLYNKIVNEDPMKGTLVEVDLHSIEPWQLPQVAKLNEKEWYFFSFRDRKYATGLRMNRATISGYWKATGKDRVIIDPKTRRTVGMRKTLVFYQNRAPNGVKSSWIMHEFRFETPNMPPKEDWVLCRVFHKEANHQHNNPNISNNGASATSSSQPPPFFNEHTLPNTWFTLNPGHPTPQIQTQTNQNPNVVVDQPSLLNPIHDQLHGGDQYEFLWDLSMEDDTILGNAHHHEFGELGFEDGNGVVLL